MKKSIFIIALFASIMGMLSSCAVRADYGYRTHPYHNHYYNGGYYHRY